MKKIVLGSVLAFALITSAHADEDKVFIGGTLGGGSGTIKISSSGGSNYTFTDSSDMSSSDVKLYVGYGQLYGFYQTGTLSPDTQYLKDLDYSAFGVGFLRRANFWALNTAVGDLVPEFDAELGYDSVTNSANDFDASGLFISVDVGAAFTIKAVKGLAITAGVGYDLHVVNDDRSTNQYDGSWNMTSLEAHVGARYSF